MRKFQNLGPCEKTCDSNKPVKITLSKNLWQSLRKVPKNTSENPVKKPWNKFWENCLRNTSGKLYENTCEQKWNEMTWNEKHEIDNENLQRHTANNEGINNVLYLYNHLRCL